MWNAGKSLAKRYCFQTFSALKVSTSLYLTAYHTVPPEFHIRLEFAFWGKFNPPSPREKVCGCAAVSLQQNDKLQFEAQKIRAVRVNRPEGMFYFAAFSRRRARRSSLVLKKRSSSGTSIMQISAAVKPPLYRQKPP